MKRSEKVAAFWREQPPTLESMFLRPDASQIEAEERKEILSYLPSFEGKKVLELAAGIGRFTGSFARGASHVTAVDLIEEFLEKNRLANSRFSNISYLCQDAMEIAFEEQSFDLIFINWLFMYLADEEVYELSHRLIRWLKPGGHLFFRESCSASGKHLDEGYYVHWRSLYFYAHLFQGRLTLLKEESIQLFEKRFANPFHCFWLHVKI